MNKMKPLTVFTWGYWGWGSHTNEFVRVTDAIERARGYRRPIFVDIRYRRNVRAKGFQDDAFERTVGKSRYRWIPELGNKNIDSKKRGRVRIAKPSAAEDLLDFLLVLRKENRRAVMFCACDHRFCHRFAVARLLIKAARQRSISTSVEDWPGGKPTTARLAISGDALKSMLRADKNVPLPQDGPEKWAALPWGSRVELQSDTGRIAVIAGPAKLQSRLQKSRWVLPVIAPKRSREGDTLTSLQSEADQLSKDYGFTLSTGCRSELGPE